MDGLVRGLDAKDVVVELDVAGLGVPPFGTDDIVGFGRERRWRAFVVGEDALGCVDEDVGRHAVGVVDDRSGGEGEGVDRSRGDVRMCNGGDETRGELTLTARPTLFHE